MSITFLQSISPANNSVSLIDFQNIPQTANDLLIIISAKTQSASATVNGNIYPNNVTSNLTQLNLRFISTGAGTGNATSGTGVFWSGLDLIGSNESSLNSTSQIYIADYARTNIIQAMSMESGVIQNGTSNNVFSFASGYENTGGGINRLVFEPFSTTWNVNTIISLYLVN
jgi:hypothetical protein